MGRHKTIIIKLKYIEQYCKIVEQQYNNSRQSTPAIATTKHNNNNNKNTRIRFQVVKKYKKYKG